MSYRCLVCGYDQMPHSPDNYHICPCCGVEYGLEDIFASYGELRNEWLLAGGPWFSEMEPFIRPSSWDAWDQLDLAGYPYDVPRPEQPVKTDVKDVPVPQGFELLRILRVRPEWSEA